MNGEQCDTAVPGLARAHVFLTDIIMCVFSILCCSYLFYLYKGACN
jgi:hypothetical protein